MGIGNTLCESTHGVHRAGQLLDPHDGGLAVARDHSVEHRTAGAWEELVATAALLTVFDGIRLQAKLVAMGSVIEDIRDTPLEWQKAIFAEICALTAFPDERARKVGLAKAEPATPAADRIAQAVARASRERRVGTVEPAANVHEHEEVF